MPDQPPPPPPPMPPAFKRRDPKKIFSATRAMWVMFPLCLLAVWAYLYLVPQESTYTGPPSVLVLVDVVLLLTVIPVTFLIRAWMFKRGRVNGVLAAATFQRGNLIFWTGCALVGIFSGQVASWIGTVWPTILIGAVTVALHLSTFPTARQMAPLVAVPKGIMRYWRVSLAGIVIVGVAAFCAWEVLKPPPAWATHPPAAVMTTQPSQFLPPEEWKAAYLEELHEVVAGRKGVDIKIYGMQRGVPREDGWVTVTSTGAGFSIAMPGPSMDMRMTAKATDGVAIVVDTLGCDEGGLKLRAVCTQRADGKVNGNEVEAMLAPYRAHPDKATVRELTMAGQKVYEIHAPSKIGFARIRICACDGATWIWAAEYKAGDESKLTPEVERYLDSFRFPAKK